MKYTKYLGLIFFIIVLGCGPKNPVLLEISDYSYTTADFKDFCQFSPADDSAKRMQMIDDFVFHMLLANEARQRGYEDDPVVKTAFAAHRKDAIAMGFYEDQIVKKSKVTDAEVHATYKKLIEQYHLAQIVVAEESLANYVGDQLKKGIPFDSLLPFSIDTATREKQGNIGPVAVISIPPDILKFLKKTKVGNATEPIHLGQYFYIFKVVDHKMADKPTFDEVSNNIRGSLLNQKAMEKGNEFTKEIFADAKIEYNDEALEVFKKPDSLITTEDLNKWVVKKYDTAYVYVRSIIDAVLFQYRQSHLDPRRLIDRVLVTDLVYDAAIRARFDKTPEMKRRLDNNMSLILYQKLYSDLVLDKAAIDSTSVVGYYRKHKSDYKDKTLGQAYPIIKTMMRDARIDSLKKIVLEDLKAKYNPVLNDETLAQLLKEEK